MKILVLANFDVGLYKFRKELLSELIKQGHKVYCALPMGELVSLVKELGCEFIETPHLQRRGTNPFEDIKLFRQYLSIIDEVKPDRIITYTVKCNIYGGLAAKRRKVPYYLNVTGLGSSFQNAGPLQKLVKFMYSRTNKTAQKIFFENEDNARIMYENGLAEKEQIVINNGAGVNVDEYPFAEYPQDDGVTRFLFIGRVMKEKGVDELFDCAVRLKKDYGDKVEFHIVGPFEENYSQHVVELTKKNIIYFYGYQNDVKPLINGSDCFVLPSYHEGMANTLLECASMGRPLITTDIHGCKEAVIDGQTGYLVNKADSFDLYEKLKMFLELPFKEKRNMGRLSRKHIEERFDKEKVVLKTISLLDLSEI